MFSTFCTFINITDWLWAHLSSSGTLMNALLCGLLSLKWAFRKQRKSLHVLCLLTRTWRKAHTTPPAFCTKARPWLLMRASYSTQNLHRHLFIFWFCIFIIFSIFMLRKHNIMSIVCSCSFCLHFSYFLWIDSQKWDYWVREDICFYDSTVFPKELCQFTMTPTVNENNCFVFITLVTGIILNICFPVPSKCFYFLISLLSLIITSACLISKTTDLNKVIPLISLYHENTDFIQILLTSLCF